MFRTVLKTVAPRAVASGRLPATVAARRSILILGPPCQGVAPLAFDLVASTRCQWRNMSSASATSANNVNVSTAGGDAAQEEGGGEGGAGGEWDGRDPKTGEGIWVDDEDEVRAIRVYWYQLTVRTGSGLPRYGGAVRVVSSAAVQSAAAAQCAALQCAAVLCPVYPTNTVHSRQQTADSSEEPTYNVVEQRRSTQQCSVRQSAPQCAAVYTSYTWHCIQQTAAVIHRPTVI